MLPVDVPPLVPARMLNEYAYCPRLFFLMWVDSLMVDSADVADGRHHHRRVDQPTGAAPLPDEGQVIAARSVDLASETLGITARLDLLEGNRGVVIPVDTKRGGPAPDGRPWEPDAVQVCAQVLLLREHGYDAPRGELYYARTRQRVEVEISDQLVERTLDIVQQARATAAKLAPPPPLESSPKCPRCSLAGICLPDENNLLAGRTDRPPRRLLPADPDARPLYVVEQGATIGTSAGRLTISKRGERITDMRLLDVSHICVYGSVQVTTQALNECFRRGISVFHFSYGAWLQGASTGLPGKNVSLRIRQNTVASRGDVAAARQMIVGKIRNSRVLLRRNGGVAVAKVVNQLAAIADLARDAAGAPELLGIEGTAARLYFGAFSHMLRRTSTLPGPEFTGLRNRRPPTDAVNCLLSFSYALLMKETFAAAYSIGFDPYVGLYHRPRFGRPALALDLAEEFRPLLADSTVLTVINNGEMTTSDFVVRAGAVALTADGRKVVIGAWERRMESTIRHPLFGYTVSYRRIIEVQARLLGAYLLGEVDRYEPFVTR